MHDREQQGSHNHATEAKPTQAVFICLKQLTHGLLPGTRVDTRHEALDNQHEGHRRQYLGPHRPGSSKRYY